MLTAHRENFSLRFAEFRSVVVEQWEELALWKDEIPLDPLWEEFHRINAQGQLVYVTLRDKGQLAGYFVGFKSTAMHYASQRVLQCDLWYVRQGWRGRLGGKKLWARVEEEAKREGMTMIKAASKLHMEKILRSGALLELVGFEPIETVWVKRI